MQGKTTNRTRAGGFTLVELMTVLAIIAILVSILIPVVGKVRTRAQIAVVQQQLNEIEGAITQFYQDQGTYPGPLPNGSLYTGPRGATAPQIFLADGSTPLPNANKITQSENLVLGLLGGLVYKTQGLNTVQCFDSTAIGRGMIVKLPNGQIKRFDPYMSYDPKSLSTGKYSDGAGQADDSDIPEFLDKFSSPMPILYMRAHVGAGGVVSDDCVAKDGTNYQYVLSDIYPYTHGQSGSIGESKSISVNAYVNSPVAATATMLPHGLQSVTQTKTLDKTSQYPYDLFPYLLSPSITPTNAAQPNATGTARSKDTYILISAGPDRVYGTADDICSFGSVVP